MTLGRRIAGVAAIVLILVVVVWQVASAAWSTRAESLSPESPVTLIIAGSCFALLAKTLRHNAQKR